MTTLERFGRREDRRRASLMSLALSGALYWIGFRQQQRDAIPPRVAPTATDAAKPADAPFAAVSERPRSWRDVLTHVWENIGRHRLLAIAAGVTFYALLAIFPAIAMIVTLYSLFADPETIEHQVSSLSGMLPGGAIEVIGDQVTRIAQGGHSSLSIAFVVSLLISLWSANAGMKAIMDALNVVYNVEERRSLVWLNLVSLAFTLTAVIFMLLALASIVVVPIVLAYLPLGSQAGPIITYARWPLMFIVIVFALSFIYRFGPDRENAQWRWITWGSTFAAVGWVCVSLLFSWYAANFASYNKTYGSLGAAVGFMTWMWLSTIVILIGAEIDAVMERWDRGSAH